MIKVRKSEERGHVDHGWLDTYHTFSFADYYDPKSMGFRALRVINEDRVASGQGFGMHGHRNMEILTYVVQGSLAHKDSMSHQKVLGPNEIQRMSAGTGVRHSEFNPSSTEPLHLFQIWIEPATMGTQPSYEQIRFDPTEKKNKLKQLAGPEGGNGAARINQDAHVFVAELARGVEIPYSLGSKRGAWVQVVRGGVAVNGTEVHTGDAAAVSGEERLALTGVDSEPSEILLFDLG
ncbi:MAG TPA: pirin family protein [Bryobacteraceae bacterium]|jgi:redox-sensitive bicupin YhaK (pirin superfamily)|nr:pirin family protein [Bryobacteraceae bacterium]